MAKKPTPATAKNASDTAPSQPWAKPAAKADSATPTADATNAPASPTQNPQAQVVNPTDSVPSEKHDQLTPTGDPDAAHEAAREEAGGNGGGAAPGDVPSELIDQHTPTGPSPEVVDERAEAGTPESSPNRVDAEAKDQETPHGEDLSSTLHAQFEELDEDERAEFEAFMNEQAKAKLAQLTRGRKAREMEVNLVDGAAHYGKRIAAPRRKVVEA